MKGVRIENFYTPQIWQGLIFFHDFEKPEGMKRKFLSTKKADELG